MKYLYLIECEGFAAICGFIGTSRDILHKKTLSKMEELEHDYPDNKYQTVYDLPLTEIE
jgi:tartrate dehydratase beta subunit/fumarate hydratase class I family protein